MTVPEPLGPIARLEAWRGEDAEHRFYGVVSPMGRRCQEFGVDLYAGRKAAPCASASASTLAAAVDAALGKEGV